MESVTLGIIFIAVWLGAVFLYCVFKAFGGNLIDILSCDCFRGGCCDCWGAGGTIDQYDYEYPFNPDRFNDRFHDPYGPYSRPQPHLPPIVVVNNMKPRREDSNTDTTDATDATDESSDDEAVQPRTPSRPPGRPKRVIDPERRDAADGALLLRSKRSESRPNVPMVV